MTKMSPPRPLVAFYWIGMVTVLTGVVCLAPLVRFALSIDDDAYWSQLGLLIALGLLLMRIVPAVLLWGMMSGRDWGRWIAPAALLLTGFFTIRSPQEPGMAGAELTCSMVTGAAQMVLALVIACWLASPAAYAYYEPAAAREERLVPPPLRPFGVTVTSWLIIAGSIFLTIFGLSIMWRLIGATAAEQASAYYVPIVAGTLLWYLCVPFVTLLAGRGMLNGRNWARYLCGMVMPAALFMSQFTSQPLLMNSSVPAEVFRLSGLVFYLMWLYIVSRPSAERFFRYSSCIPIVRQY